MPETAIPDWAQESTSQVPDWAQPATPDWAKEDPQSVVVGLRQSQLDAMMKRSAGTPRISPWGDVPGQPQTELTQALYQELPATIGRGLETAGKVIYEGGVNAIANTIAEFQPPSAGEGAATLSTEKAIREYPAPVQAGIKGVAGVVESLPKMAIYAADPGLGILAFGTTPEGFDPKQAAIAAVLPVIGKYTGAITEAIAAKLGVPNETALLAFNKIGGATGAASLIAADEWARIRRLPQEEQSQAIIDAAGNVGAMFLLGAVGEAKRSGLVEATENLRSGDIANLAPNTAAVLRSSLPPRPSIETLPELQRTAELVDQALQESQQKIVIPGRTAAIDLLKAQGIEITPATIKLAERNIAPGETFPGMSVEGVQVQPKALRSASDILVERDRAQRERNQNAIQVQEPNAGVLRSEGPKVGLPQVGTRNPEPEITSTTQTEAALQEAQAQVQRNDVAPGNEVASVLSPPENRVKTGETPPPEPATKEHDIITNIGAENLERGNVSNLHETSPTGGQRGVGGGVREVSETPKKISDSVSGTYGAYQGGERGAQAARPTPQIIERINRRDTRNWGQLPSSFERDSVKAAFQEIKELFPRKAIAERVRASKATSFVELREAVNSAIEKYQPELLPPTPPATSAGMETKQPWELTKQQYREREARGFDSIAATATTGKTIVGDPIRTPEELKAFKKSTLQSAEDTRAGKNATVDYMHKALVKKALDRGDPVPASVLSDYPTLPQSSTQSPRSGTAAGDKPTTPSVVGEQKPPPSPVKPGGGLSTRTAEEQAKSKENNSLKAMAEANGVTFVEGDTPESLMAKINAKASTEESIIGEHRFNDGSSVVVTKEVAPKGVTPPAGAKGDFIYKIQKGSVTGTGEGVRTYWKPEDVQKRLDKYASERSGKSAKPAPEPPPSPAGAGENTAEVRAKSAQTELEAADNAAGKASNEAEKAVVAWATHVEDVVNPLKEKIRKIQSEVGQMQYDAQRTKPETKGKQRLTKKKFLEQYGVASMEEANALYKQKNAEWSDLEKQLEAAESKRKELEAVKERRGKEWSSAATRAGELRRQVYPKVREGDVGQSTPPPSEPPSGVDRAIKSIEDLQKKIRGSGSNLGMNVPVALLDTALEVARLALKAGKSITEAIDAAIEHIRKHASFEVKSSFDEKEVRSKLMAALSPSHSAETPPKFTAKGTTKPVTPEAGETLADVYKIFEPTPRKRPAVAQIASSATEAIRTGLASKFRPLDKLAQDIAKAYKIHTPQGIAGIFEQLKGSSGKGEADVYRFDQEVSKPVRGLEKDFNAYMFLRRSLDRLLEDANDINRAIAGEEVKKLNRRAVADYTIPQLQSKLALLESQLGPEIVGVFKQAAEAYQRHMDTALKLQVESGRMSPDVYQAIKNGNQFYAPFKVMKYLQETSMPEGSGRRVDTLADFTKAMEGITDKNFRLGDMLGAARQNILLSRILAEKNKAMLKLTELAGLDTDHRFIYKIQRDQSVPPDMESVNVLENGKSEKYVVNKDVAQALQVYGPQSQSFIVKILSAFGVPFRAGATALNIPFQVSNLLADQPRAALISRYGINGATDLIRYPLDFVYGLYSSITGDMVGAKNKLMLDFLDSGVAGTTIQETLTPKALDVKPYSVARTAARNILYAIPDFAKAIEQTSKIIGVKRAMRFHGVESGAELAAKYPEAITELRRFSGSPDFGRQGKWVEQARLNLLYMFFNARLQGMTADLGRLVGRDGAGMASKTWARLGIAVGVPTVYAYLLNRSDKYSDDYDKRPKQEKQNYWLIPKDTYITGPDGEKIRDYWRIPKRESAKWIANMTEAALEFARNRDPEHFSNFAVGMMEDISPVNIQGKNFQERLESTATSLNPLIKAPIEMASNRDMYRHRDIVPFSMQKASPDLQYTDRTPQVFRDLASKMPGVVPEVLRSPMQLEQLTRNLTAGLITQFLPRKPVEGRSGIENNPLLQRFQGLPVTDREEFDKQMEGLQRESADAQLNRDRMVKKLLEDNKSKPLKEVVKIAVEKFGKDARLVYRLIDVGTAESLGLSTEERRVLFLPTEQRAQYLADKFKTLDAAAKTAMIRDYAKKRIYTKAVAEELNQILKTP